MQETRGGQTLTQSYGYDNRGLITSYTDANGNTFGYQYDGNGNLTQITYPNNQTVTYTYDDDNRLHTVTDWASRVTTYTYDDNGRPTQIAHPNGTTTNLTYNNAGELSATEEVLPNTNIFFGQNLNRYADSKVNTVEAVAYTAVQPDQSVAMTYDSDNRVATWQSSALSWDNAGNMTSGPAPSLELSANTPSTFANYTYNARGELAAVGTVSYTYDPSGNRMSLVDGTKTTTFAVSPVAAVGSLDQMLARTVTVGTTTTPTYYVYGLGLLYEINSSGTPSYYHFDHQGNTVAMTDNAGALIGRVQYAPNGQITQRDTAITTPFLWQGQWGVMCDRGDNNNGLYFLRTRYYHPAMASFIQQDSILGDITDPQSLNRFAYCQADPINFYDPEGLLATGIGESAVDTINAILHPFLTAQNAWYALTHLDEVSQSIADFAGAMDWNSDTSAYERGRMSGNIIGNIFIGGLSGRAVVGVGKWARNASKAARNANKINKAANA